MKTIYFPYWNDLVKVLKQSYFPRGGRYLCSDENYSYYDVDKDYIVAVPIGAM